MNDVESIISRSLHYHYKVFYRNTFLSNLPQSKIHTSPTARLLSGKIWITFYHANNRRTVAYIYIYEVYVQNVEQ